MKRLMVLGLSVIVLTSVISPTFAFANELKNNNINVDVINQKNYVHNLVKIIENDPNFNNLLEVLNYNDNGLSILDKKTGKISKIVYNDSKTEAKVYEENGQVNIITRDKSDNIYLNGVLSVEAIKNDSINLQKSFASNGGWQKVTTFRTKASYYQTTASIALAILGLIPGLSYAATIAGIATTIMNSGQPEVYIEMTQYFNSSTRFFRVDSRYYKYSNYTGLIKSVRGGEYRIY